MIRRLEDIGYFAAAAVDIENLPGAVADLDTGPLEGALNFVAPG